MNPTGLVVDREEFSALRGECENIIDTQKRLPDFVFRRSFSKYFVIEYNYIYREDFGSFLYEISNFFDDGLVNYMTLDPDPSDHNYQQFSYFGVARFDPKNLKEEYVPTMYRGPGPKFLVSTNVGVFWGSSLKWGIMCDRISWEIAVIAVPKDIDVSTISGFRCMDASTLSSYMLSQYSIKNPSIALDFVQRFLSNYRI